MRILRNAALSIFVAAALWWNGYSLFSVLLGTIAILTVFSMMYSVGDSIERWTGRSAARNARSDTAYYAISISGILLFLYLVPDAGVLLSMLAFGITMTTGRIAGQLLFGYRGSPAALPD